VGRVHGAPQHRARGNRAWWSKVPRTTTVHALQDSELMKIEQSELRELLRHHTYMKEVLSRYHLDLVTATAEMLKAFVERARVESIVS